MNKLLLRLSIHNTAIVFSLLTILFMIFFLSPSYKSESIFEVPGQSTEIASSGILGSFISAPSSNSYLIKSFLESEESSEIFRNSINVESVFNNPEISYFSSYKSFLWKNSFHKYYLNQINVVVDNDTNAIVLSTKAFSPNEAYMINLEIINIVSDFLDRTSRLSSYNSKTQKICDLYYINADIWGDSSINLEYQTSIELTSANELLMQRSRDFKEFCENELEKIGNQENLKNNKLFPIYEVKNINADASKKILTEMFEDSLNSVSASNQIKVIAEPILSSNSESKNIFLYVILVYFVTIISLLSIKAIIRLTSEFEA